MQQAEVVRKTLIELALRRQQPGSGSSPDFLRRRTARVEWPDIRDLMREVHLAVVGAVATRHYMPERATQDLGIVIAVRDAPLAREKLQEAGWACKGELSIGGSSWKSLDGVSLDVLEGKEHWWTSAIAEAQENLDLQGLPIVPFRYLALMKFRSARTQDIADISRMLGQATIEELEDTRALFRAEEPVGLEDLESLIYLGQLEFQG